MIRIQRISLRGVSPMRVLLLVSAALLMLMLLYPPYHVVTREGQFNAGYGWLLAPPMVSSWPSHLSRAIVDVPLLVTQFIGVLASTAISYAALSPQRRGGPVVTAPTETAQRILDAILESDVATLQAALSQAISAEITRRR